MDFYLIVFHSFQIAGGRVNSEAGGVAPPTGFDLRRLVPQDFRPPGDNTQWIVPAAPVMVQASIENGSTNPNDLYKMLGQENLKFWFTRLLSPGGRATDEGNPHPLWTSFLADIRISGYKFEQIPRGLTNTAQLHIQQAATSIGNLWSGPIYKKAFKHLVTNALRLRLAPERFRRSQRTRRPPKATRDEDESETRKMPRSQWSLLVARRLDELAEVCRKDDMSDEKTCSRIRGIMLSLQCLKKLERRVSDEPSLIPKLSVRQLMALAEAKKEAGKEQQGQLDQDHSEQPLQQQQLQETWHTSTATENHPFIDAIASDNNSGNGEQTMDDALDDTYSDDDMEDEDGEWVPDEEDNEMAANEFDDNYQPPEQDTDDEIGNDGVPTQDETGNDGLPTQDEMSNNNAPIQETTVETSGKQIHRLFTVAKILIHSPHITHNVSNDNVRKALLKNMEATDKELSAVRDIVNWLRPFAPKRVQTETGYRDHTGHVALCAPMVLIAQAFFDVTNLHKFKGSMCPQTSVGSTMALHLSSGVLYELFGSGGAEQFDIRGSNGSIITTANDAASPSNKEAVIASIFDLDKVKTICNDYNLDFDNRYNLLPHL